MKFPDLCTCTKGKTSEEENEKKKQRIKIHGTVVLVKKSALDFNDFVPSMLDGAHELLHDRKSVSFRLISSTTTFPNNPKRGMVGDAAYLKDWVNNRLTKKSTGESHFNVEFEWDKEHGIPGAVIVKNKHHVEFYLKSITLNDVLDKGCVHFVCNSWVCPAKKYKYDRVFFTNDTYLPSQMPEALKQYREEELISLRGDNVLRKLKEHDRVYGYEFYNDLGDPDKGKEYERHVLGGSHEYPYPRRGRTGRKPTKKDPKTESRIPLLLSTQIYVPRDERFGHLKMSDFYAYALKALGQAMVPALKTKFNKTASFESFKDTFELYKDGIKLHKSKQLEKLRKKIHSELLKELLRTDDAELLRLPLPEVLQADEFAWRTDEEFAREMLAGLNPVVIRRLEEFPPTSKLDPSVYGNQNSTIKAEQIEKYMELISGERLSVIEALERNRLFILDHHDTFMPWLPKLNSLDPENMFIYATRTILFLNDDSTLWPLAIELSWPHHDGLQHGAMSQVYLPASEGVEESIWQLAKAYVAVNDSGYHQLISHWLNTHAVIEPFVIATNRQLSVTHPIHKLLSPHYRDTMNINALARQTLINAAGIFELTVFPGKYALEMSSAIYRNWKLTEQGLPDDLLKRGVAVKDQSCDHNLQLLIEDYPYAVDGLAIWSAIESWVNDYCSIYYPNDSLIQTDTELQAWWKEIRDVGHGDLKNEKWWPDMHKFEELTKTCTTIIWVASALHAAVNFGQYSYAGYLPNRPTISRQRMPEAGTKEYDELTMDPEKVFLKTITSKLQTILGISLIEILSRHSTDEVYLGQRDTKEWTSDERAVRAFEQFKNRLEGIEKNILEMNNDKKLKNRRGPVQMPYMLLYPNTSDESHEGGLSVKGIPNSVSI
ncbi:hypothetical protein LUZ63_005874 [Rhynchospora breviuscula]|uniref:Lipoxygenase n=1 Tax=Rhynchospora breviuscula TaxID=2022672 RepID=A0A9Q0HSZ8_9POAL|nr:hypothetical protein LUZ63_005874 [Rhynchospora breviuscula]